MKFLSNFFFLKKVKTLIISSCLTFFIFQSQAQISPQTTKVLKVVDVYYSQFKPINALKIIEPYFKKTAQKKGFPVNDYIVLANKYISILEIADQNSEAILEANKLKDKYILSDTTLVILHTTLARMYEKVGDKNNTIKNLKKAKNHFTSLTNDNLKLTWNVRMSSYHRMFGNKDSALVYAKKALTYEGLEKSSAYFLIAFLEKDFLIQVRNLKIVVELFKKRKDYTGLAYMYNNLYKAYDEKGYDIISKKYLDSSVIVSKRLDFNDLEADLSQTLSEYHERKGNLDSALFYSKKNIYFEKKDRELKSHEQIYFANRKYENEKLKKSLNTIQSELNITNELQKVNEKKNIFKNWLLFTAFLFFIAVIIFIVLQIKQKKIIENDSKIINEKNRELLKTIHYNEILEQELHHRVKNNLSLILSIISFQTNEIDDEYYKDKFDVLKNRVKAIAIVHEKHLSKSNNDTNENQNIKDYLDEIVKSLIGLQNDKINYNDAIEKLYFPIEISMPLGILINELVSNTIKHAITSNTTKTINLEINKVENKLITKYSDNGETFTIKKETNKENLGLFIIESMITQLNGTYIREKSTYTITINLENR